MFALSALPQALMTYEQGHARGLSAALLTMWGVGETGAIIYGSLKKLPLALMVNYAFNLGCLSVIIYYYLFPRI
jgi:hypothetical protein